MTDDAVLALARDKWVSFFRVFYAGSDQHATLAAGPDIIIRDGITLDQAQKMADLFNSILDKRVAAALRAYGDERARQALEKYGEGGEVKAEYKPLTTKAKLGYLIEECGETLAAAGKTLRWGLGAYNPEIPENERETNRDWLLRELTDLTRAIRYVREVLLAEPPA